MRDLVDLLRRFHFRLDRLQRTRNFRIVALVLVAILSGFTWGRLMLVSADLETQRSLLVNELAGKNIEAGDVIALDLAEKGVITVNGREYGDPVLVNNADLLFSPEGDIERPEALADLMVRDKTPEWAPRWLVEQPRTTMLLASVSTGLLILVVLSASTVGFATSVFIALLGWLGSTVFGLGDAGLAVIAMSVLVFSYLLLSKVVMGLLDPSHHVLAVAHTVMKEATRTGIPLVFVIGLLIALPLLPFGLDPDSPLRYRIQTFISRSVGLSFYVAACMTLFLACATVAFEIRDRQIWQLVTKPVSRGAYLLGKWIGIVAVNAVIIAVASISIFAFIQYQRQLPVAPGVQGLEDLQQIRDSVLTARVAVRPDFQRLSDEQLRTRVLATLDEDPDLAGVESVPLEYQRRIAREIIDEHERLQRQIPPGGVQTYTFNGLDTNFADDEMITLRYRFFILRNDEHQTFPAMFRFNEDNNLFVQRTYVPSLAHTVTIPAQYVRDDGSLTVDIANMFQGQRIFNGRVLGEINFDPDGFELLYRVGTFEGNFVRAMLANLVKLAFLAMLGIVCGTFLNFPVACLTAFTVFIAGTMGPYVAGSLEYYGPVPWNMLEKSWNNVGGIVNWFVQTTIKIVAGATVWLLESFGRVRPANALVEGRMISWGAVFGDAVRIGFVWSGLALALGWAVFRRRQLAIYSGQG